MVRVCSWWQSGITAMPRAENPAATRLREWLTLPLGCGHPPAERRLRGGLLVADATPGEGGSQNGNPTWSASSRLFG